MRSLPSSAPPRIDLAGSARAVLAAGGHFVSLGAARRSNSGIPPGRKPRRSRVWGTASRRGRLVPTRRAAVGGQCALSGRWRRTTCARADNAGTRDARMLGSVIMCAMTDDLYERYKEALRTGHVAVLRGSLEEALAAYRLAAEIAPSRALPHTSLGGVYMRLGHLEDALTEFAAAVATVPARRGSAARTGRSAERRGHAQRRRGRPRSCGRDPGGGRPAARSRRHPATGRRARRGAERIRRQRALLREIRFSAGDHAAEQLLARALRLRDEPAPMPSRPGAGPGVAASCSRSAARRMAAAASIRPSRTPGPPTVRGNRAYGRPEPEPRRRAVAA